MKNIRVVALTITLYSVAPSHAVTFRLGSIANESVLPIMSASIQKQESSSVLQTQNAVVEKKQINRLLAFRDKYKRELAMLGTAATGVGAMIVFSGLAL
ncbi:MAG TPA: hypothetical protein VGT41_05920 [Candidatus Babeliales bacterium]|nr:hypothetical protein [Candidatus Babeliales bacterium]